MPPRPDPAHLGSWKTTSVGGEHVRAFVPPPLPPVPPLHLDPLLPLLGRADRALGRLDGLTRILPDPELFLYAYVRKEALVSSQIEGTQSTLADLFALEAGVAQDNPFDDVVEVSRYVAAMTHGLRRLAELPLSLRLIREMHTELMRAGRGRDQQPGEFRTSQNWIGGTRPGTALFVPPPPQDVLPCLDALERFLHATAPPLPPLVRAGLAHVQFETIHPFLDGNGRLGRLLVTLMLCVEGVLREPLLYLSLYLKTHRDAYYGWLQEVRLRGDWEGWLAFFLEGVDVTATNAVASAERILALFEADRRRAAGLPTSVLRLLDALGRQPVTSQRRLSATTGLTAATVNAGLVALTGLGILREITGRARGRLYAYSDYLAILSEGTEPLPP